MHRSHTTTREAATSPRYKSHSATINSSDPVQPMKPLLWLANIFVNTFGITQPSPENARRMAVYIGLLLLGVVVGVTIVAFTIRGFFRL